MAPDPLVRFFCFLRVSFFLDFAGKVARTKRGQAAATVMARRMLLSVSLMLSGLVAVAAHQQRSSAGVLLLASERPSASDKQAQAQQLRAREMEVGNCDANPVRPSCLCFLVRISMIIGPVPERLRSQLPNSYVVHTNATILMQSVSHHA
jgi:phage terminase Nu1 subunit (DNA packaging protein)